MRFSRPLALLAAAVLTTSPLWAEEGPSEYERAKQRIAGDSHDLRYRFTAGETIRWDVTHLATVDTKIKGNLQSSKSRSVSTRVWKVDKVDEAGNITLTNSIEKLIMWSQVTGQEEVKYNSETDASAPSLYAEAAKMVGKPLATVTLDPHGRITARDSDRPETDLGFGAVVLPLPGEPVKIGSEWTVPRGVHVRLRNGQARVINTQQRHTLTKVETGVATIAVRTEVLTPVNDPEVQSQLVQRLTHGEIKFDVDAGRVISRQMDLDETVIGFNGPDSIMTYLARYTEQMLNEPVTASLPKPPAPETPKAPAPESEASDAEAELPLPPPIDLPAPPAPETEEEPAAPAPRIIESETEEPLPLDLVP